MKLKMLSLVIMGIFPFASFAGSATVTSDPFTVNTLDRSQDVLVHFNANGGEFVDGSGNRVTEFNQYFTYDVPQELFTDELVPQKPGNRFLGWVIGKPEFDPDDPARPIIEARAERTWHDDVTEVTFYAVWTFTIEVSFCNSGDDLIPSSLADHMFWRVSDSKGRLAENTGRMRSGESVQVRPGTWSISFYIDDEIYKRFLEDLKPKSSLYRFEYNSVLEVNTVNVHETNNYLDYYLGAPSEGCRSVAMVVGPPENETCMVWFECAGETVSGQTFRPSDANITLTYYGSDGSGTAAVLSGFSGDDKYYPLPWGEYKVDAKSKDGRWASPGIYRLILSDTIQKVYLNFHYMEGASLSGMEITLDAVYGTVEQTKIGVYAHSETGSRWMEVPQLPTPMFTDHQFLGWWTEPNGKGRLVESGTKFFGAEVGDKTLYAHWDMNTLERALWSFGRLFSTSSANGFTLATLTYDVRGTVEIPDNAGAVTIDLNGHSIVGTDGDNAQASGPAIRIVCGEGEGETTQLSIVDTSDGERGRVVGGNESPGIEVDADSISGVSIDVEDGVQVFNGDGSVQSLDQMFDNLPDGYNVSEVGGRKWIWRHYDDGVELVGYYVSSWDENGEWYGGTYCGVYPAPEGAVEIPSEIEGVRVVRLGDYLLFECEDVVSVSIPESVKSVGYMAFAYSGVESVSVPEGVEELDESAFYGCYALSDVSLPSTLEYIGQEVFAGCPSLDTIRVASGNERYAVRGGILYDNADKIAIAAESDLTTADIESGTLEVADYAFGNCAGLASVRIPASVQRIGYDAFPEDADAIYDTTSVPGVRVIDGWTIGPDWTATYESLYLGGIRGIAVSAFSGVEVRSLAIPQTCEWICSDAFYGCSALETLTVPASVRAIGDWAFERCSSLASVTFEGDMLAIDMDINEAFAETPWLANFAPEAPENDKFAQATELCGTSGSVMAPSYGATVEDGEPLAYAYGSTASVWWRWEAPADGKVIMDTFGSSFDTVLGVYTGADVAALETVAECDDAESVDDNTSEAEFEATAGTAYYIAVAGYRAHTGRVILNWTYDPPLRLANVPVAIDSALVDGIDIDSLVFVVGRAYGADLERLTREIESSVARHGVAFAGWVNGDGSAITPATIVKDGDTLTARWEKFNPLADDDDAVDASAAQVYNGYALDADGNVAGTILVKVGKPNAKTGLASVSATLQMVGEKKIAFKASEKGKARLEGDGNATHGVTLVNAKAADDIVLETISENGIHGAYGEYEIVCARNRSKKDAGAYSKWVRTVEVALATKEATGAGADMAGGYSGVSVAIGAKGKVKVTGTMADGAKVSATGQLLVAEDGRQACVNVFVPMYSGKKGGVAFLLWLGEGGSVEIESLGEWVCMDRKGAFTAGLEFVDAATLAAPSGQKAFSVAGIPASVGGTTVHEKYLPVSVAVTAQGGRLAVAKANKVKLDKATGLPISTGGTDNDCALKLTYAAKNGTIKGSFVVWTQSGAKLKKIKATVAGIVVRGKGYGSAIIKNVGSFPVTLD